MRFLGYMLGGALCLVLAMGLGGCLRSAHSQLDEEKEPHFLAGKRHANAFDYQGALDCFEKALETNPHSASAHFEAGLLYEQHKLDHAAAIYHFQRFLELRPNSEYADVVKQRILACKQELAKAVSLGPVSQSLQRDYERLLEENKRLQEQVERWRTTANQVQSSNNAAPPVLSPRSPQPGGALASTSTRSPATSAAASPAGASAARAHTVKPGDTPSAIARRYGVKLDVLMAANPRLDPRRLQIGQTLSIPSPDAGTRTHLVSAPGGRFSQSGVLSE